MQEAISRGYKQFYRSVIILRGILSFPFKVLVNRGYRKSTYVTSKIHGIAGSGKLQQNVIKRNTNCRKIVALSKCQVSQKSRWSALRAGAQLTNYEF